MYRAESEGCLFFRDSPAHIICALDRMPAVCLMLHVDHIIIGMHAHINIIIHFFTCNIICFFLLEP